MFGNKKRKIPISKSDIKQAVLAANKRLKNENDNLSKANKEAEAKAKEAAKQQKALEKEILALSKEKESLGSNIASLKTNYYKVNKQIKDANVRYDEMCSLISGAETGYATLNKKNKSLERSINFLEEKKSKSKEINAELKNLKSLKACFKDEIDTLTYERNTIQESIAGFELDKISAQSSYEKLKQDLFDEEASINGILSRIEDKIVENNKTYETESARLNNMLADKEEEISVMNSLLEKKENEYVISNNRMKQADAQIKAAQIKASSIEIEAKAKVDTIKENFKKWKLTALEEVAKLKLKNKIANIDKAGLSEILNG